ncbi:phosphoribosylaminoimidazole-succinocarboxamide synthase [Archaeoglobus sulfaticallidus PM70-1]|uniref:Phosphoribosylaminoimidazole-succinocarboxamide synthase n=1 Tax=Archaeoglobus sulfaticallidus PM70-1 TaxID=387631 RepID=N0BJY6_9EURY|nr:phosphoribosylaminoimidazolesuccinocarboxamide synthase [Archaeoglobus sulfaticallidus]AGK60445.1 phosphoribosylaminoimidazole-succinocarboxamide synthase [Archaeoglobus sulfaticallidus PM70-1]
MGSVKDLRVIEHPDGEKAGVGVFTFSDRYSVFDYGEMPDKIDGKGASLCLISAYFFERLEEEGIETHYLGLLDGEKVKRIDEIEKPVNEMKVKLFRVIKPHKNNGYDYSAFKEGLKNYLIPLEVIYRNKLPEGSSVFRRLERGELKLEDLGLKEKPVPGMKLERPIIDFSTKLEDEDRYLSVQEAKEISGLGENLEKLIDLTMKINDIITRRMVEIGIENEDGKVEFAVDEKGSIVLVDAVGTPDECRFSYDGFELSKEILRRHYRKTYWYKRLRVTKGTENWRKVMGRPPNLPENLRVAVSNMYKAIANEVIGRKIFDCPSLKEVVKELKEIKEST